jgi:hypothetical protein
MTAHSAVATGEFRLRQNSAAIFLEYGSIRLAAGRIR